MDKVQQNSYRPIHRAILSSETFKLRVEMFEIRRKTWEHLTSLARCFHAWTMRMTSQGKYVTYTGTCHVQEVHTRLITNASEY
jgi:hypothetical protein